MTTTTGLPTVVPALAETVDVALQSPLVSTVRSWNRVPWMLGCADVIAAAATAAVAGAMLPAWSPAELLALVVVWPLVVAACGGYTSIGGSPNAVRPKTLLRAAALAALVAWTAVAVSPDLVPGTARGAARSVLLVVALAPAFSVVLRRAGQLLAHPGARRVVLIGDAAGLHHLLHEARRATRSGATDLLPVAVCLQGRQPLDAADLADASDDLTVWLGTEDLLEVVRAHRADAVVVAPGSDIGHPELRRWGAWLQDHGDGAAGQLRAARRRARAGSGSRRSAVCSCSGCARPPSPARPTA